MAEGIEALTHPEMKGRLTALLQPIRDSNPCGEPVRYSPEYDQLRELRREDDPTLPAGVWESDLKKADWVGVERLAQEVLTGRSKDLMVAAWLGESWLHLLGLSGLEAALTLVLRYCESYWDGLHPLPRDGDMSFRAAPLEWLAKCYASTVEMRVPLLAPSGGDNTLTLAHWRDLKRRLGKSEASDEMAQARQEMRLLEERVRAQPGCVDKEGLEVLARSRVALQGLEEWCAQAMAADTPSFGGLWITLEQLARALSELAAMCPDDGRFEPLTPFVASQVEKPPEHSNDASATTLAAAREPASREEAYRQLRRIADYLARTEPHSPVPYLIQRAVEWGDKPLRELLAELLDSDTESRRLWSLLGVLP
ncbi:type VI secretion system protein TssA [Chromobacterium sp. IIBBL 290-4]|uniref:type VI secretion system protein TssA n=1 Tax=Chromobacterium sp. IIBBL 290-4 TaxID=2953890 RepID=UPI0020B826D1|nr:type VI secretion system protein TssA [Chromobacterium sp. IIBBL 290-4]UTH75140.1 type VI secretion system protein TssA [Chromobacterium sp. IIBBL 290-4]